MVDACAMAATKCGVPHDLDQVGIEESSGGAVHLPKHSFSPTPHTFDVSGIMSGLLGWTKLSS